MNTDIYKKIRDRGERREIGGAGYF